MQKSVLNKQRKFGVKILWHYTDMAIFALRCFILTHPVHTVRSNAVRYTRMQQPHTDATILRLVKHHFYHTSNYKSEG